MTPELHSDVPDAEERKKIRVLAAKRSEIGMWLFVLSVAMIFIPAPIGPVPWQTTYWILRISGCALCSLACSGIAQSNGRETFHYGLIGLILPPLGMLAWFEKPRLVGGR